MNSKKPVAAGLRILTAALSLLVLTGCQATLTTDIRAAGDSVTGTFVVELVDEAAQALLSDPATDQKLLQTISDRTGQTVARDSSANRITYRSGLPTDLGLGGISGVTITGLKSDGSTLEVALNLTRPNELVEALKSATAGESDAEARLLVLERTTRVCTKVTFAGGIINVSSSGPVDIQRSSRSITACSTLEALSAEDATVVVKGTPKRNIIPYAVGVAFLFTLGAIAYRRWLKR